MPSKPNSAKRSKVKIGTILDEDIMQQLRERAAREGRAISSLIKDAVANYQTGDTLTAKMRLKAMDQLFSIRFDIPARDRKTIMDSD